MATFTLRQLEYFAAVVEEGTVTGAARRLHVSPGGVSLALAELEAALKIQLTRRQRGKGAAVTPAGRHVYQRVRSVLGDVDDIAAAALTLRGELVGPLAIGCFSTLSPWLFPRIAAHFAEHHPGVDVTLHEGESAPLQDGLRSGELDAALVYSNHLGPGVDGEEIIPTRLQIALHPEHRLARLPEIPLRELEHETAILLGLEPAGSHVEEMLREAGFTPHVRWRSTNVETIRSMVARGLGYTIIMGRPYGDRTYDGLPIVYRRIADDIPANAVVVAFARGTVPTAKVRALMDFCRGAFSQEGEPLN